MKHKIFVIIFFLAVSTLFAQSSTEFVYVTSNGKKYHTQYCRTIKNSTVKEIRKTDAEKAGYSACKICKP